MSRSDRAIGIVLGIVIGIFALIAFVFFGSSGSIDAPSIDHNQVERTATDTTGDPRLDVRRDRPAALNPQSPLAGKA